MASDTLTDPVPTHLKFSVVIPVYNSEAIIADTVQRTVAFFEHQHWNFEIVLVNDGSSDNSWGVISALAQQDKRVIAINLLRNYGQHTSVFCGFHYTSGDYVITIDDDLQNPPEEIVHLVRKALQGFDAVYGKYNTKQHTAIRRLGSRIIEWFNRRIFNVPSDLTVTNFRVLRKDVIERMINYRTAYPYINGLSIMFSSNRANVRVEHHPREDGKSGYNIFKILALVGRIMFSYSAFPMQIIVIIGISSTLLALVLGTYYLFRAILVGTTVPGWTTVVVMLSFFNVINLSATMMLSEYVVRLTNQFNTNGRNYYIKSIINSE